MVTVVEFLIIAIIGVGFGLISAKTADYKFEDLMAVGLFTALIGIFAFALFEISISGVI